MWPHCQGFPGWRNNINSSYGEYIWGNLKHIFAFYIIPQHWNIDRSWDSPSRKTRTSISDNWYHIFMCWFVLRKYHVISQVTAVLYAISLYCKSLQCCMQYHVILQVTAVLYAISYNVSKSLQCCMQYHFILQVTAVLYATSYNVSHCSFACIMLYWTMFLTSTDCG